MEWTVGGVGMRGYRWKGAPTNEESESLGLGRLFVCTNPLVWVSLYVVISAVIALPGLWVQG